MAATVPRCLLLFLLALFFGRHEVVSQGAVRSLHIHTNIVYRFATTSVRSVVVNTRQVPDDVTFLYHLPREAFVSNFSMTIQGVEYSGRLEGIESKRLYRPVNRNEAQEQITRVRNTNTFRMSVHIAPRSEVTFDLVYHELLKRRLAVHSHVVYLEPGQVVPDLNISVNIVESRALTILNIPPLQNFMLDDESNEIGVNQLASLKWGAPNAVEVTFAPTIQDQRNISPSGISGKFIVSYDVGRTSDAGQLQVINGYFVHYFAPAGYRPIPRRVVFVLDVSGSMKGEKIAQLKTAMTSILNELGSEDLFNIIVFSSGYTRWQRSLVPATATNKDAALLWFKRDVHTDGLTNINDALITALTDLQGYYQTATNDQGIPYVLFLTDGDPTAGETDVAKILHNIRSYNTRKTSIYTVGFGRDVKIPFLQRISIQNGGFARKIYATSDASLQLQGFFNEISNPLLSDVKITYTGNTVDESTVTKTDYNLFFNGSEIFVTGRLRVPTISGITATVQANSRYGPMTLSKKSSSTSYGLEVPSPAVLSQNVERMWAYSLIKDTVRKAFESDNRVERATLRRRTKDLSLRYNILSPATILVAPSPNSPGQVVDILQADSPSPRQDPDDRQVPGEPGKPQGKPVPKPEYPPQNNPLPEAEGAPERPDERHPLPEGERRKYPDGSFDQVTLNGPENEEEPPPYVERPKVSERPGHPEQKPDESGSRPDHSGSRPDHPGNRPDHAGGRPDHPGNRPDHSGGRPDHPGNRPDHSGSRQDHPGKRPDHPESRPDHPDSRDTPDHPGNTTDHSGSRKQPDHSVGTSNVKPDASEEIPMPHTGADNDPHVILDVMNIDDEFVCFDLHGSSGDIIQLLDDPDTETTVRGLIIPRTYKAGVKVHHTATYFGQIGIRHKNSQIIMETERVIVDGRSHLYEVGAKFTSGEVSVLVLSETKVLVTIGDDIKFLILLHTIHHDFQTSYLGFYFMQTDGLSSNSEGMLGEFLDLEISVDISHEEAESSKLPGKLTRLDEPLPHHDHFLIVNASKRRNYANNLMIKCWYAHNNARGLLKKPLKDYKMDSLV